jgi:hypothetical protein
MSISAPTLRAIDSARFASFAVNAATAAVPLSPTFEARPASSALSLQPTCRNRSPMRTPVIDTCNGSIAAPRVRRINIRRRNIMTGS